MKNSRITVNRLARFPTVSRNLAASSESSETPEGLLSSLPSRAFGAAALLLSAFAVLMYRRRALYIAAESDREAPEIDRDAAALV